MEARSTDGPCSREIAVSFADAEISTSKELRQVTDFRSLGVSGAVADVLAARGIETPFQIQALVSPEALSGGDVLA